MRLAGIGAQDFWSFQDVDLELDDQLTMVVGPNGAGKSNLFAGLLMVDLALQWSTGMADSYARLQSFSAAVRHGSSPRRFMFAMQLTCSESWERQLWTTFVRGAVAAGLTSPQLHSTESTRRAAQVIEAITEETTAPLFAGRLVLRYTERPNEQWMLGYEFEEGGNSYCFIVQGGGAGYILPGSLPFEPARSFGGPALTARLLEGTADAELEPLPLKRLLPGPGEATQLQIGQTGGDPTAAIDTFLSITGDPNAGRTYNAGWVLRRIVENGLTYLSGHRLPPATRYELSEENRARTVDGGQVPAELYRLRNGTLAQRNAYDKVAALFTDLTNCELGLRLSSEDTSGRFIEPTVVDRGVEIPMAFAGAGRWEALVASSVLSGAVGRILVLDEPAVNLSPTLQRRLLDRMERAPGIQVVLVTHSPYLISTRRASDLERVARVANVGGRSTVKTIAAHAALHVPNTRRMEPTWRQLLAGRSEVRSLLFASGVILVEGDTDVGVFEQWFAQAEQADLHVETPDALNLQILAVGSDTQFGSHVSLLEALAIPWVILCDGPVLSPRYAHCLLKQLRAVGVLEESLPTPTTGGFLRWKVFWSNHRAFTVAGRFGLRRNGTPDKSGELEAYLNRLSAPEWSIAQRQHPKSKILAGRLFAENVRCPMPVARLYGDMVRTLLQNE